MYNGFCSAAGTRLRKVYNRLDGIPGEVAGRFFTTGR